MFIKEFSRPQIMGVLNLTPDSFSDGGRYDTDKAVARGLEMIGEGADIIDIGGESTRPGAKRISVAEQIDRVLDTIIGLADRLPADIPISIDTTKSEVAAKAIEQGAGVINDISAGRDDPEMFALAASTGVTIVLMHMQGSPEMMQRNPVYKDVISEVMRFLESRIEAAVKAGVSRESIVIDPGIGFGKGRRHNLQLLAHLKQLKAMGYPLMLGASRKGFMGSLCEVSNPHQLIPATCSTTALGVIAGVDLFRVHDVWQNRQAADVAWAVQQFAADSKKSE
ncbi:MAG: dihydropteroate synthase [Chromatiales bacterium]|nr:dihydropteroate synthase [Chromatiales bacterium]